MTDTVYPYVPVEVVKLLLKKHGGIDNDKSECEYPYDSFDGGGEFFRPATGDARPDLKNKTKWPLRMARSDKPYKSRYTELNVSKTSIEEDLNDFITEFGAEISDDSFDYAGTHCTHGQSGTHTVISHISSIEGIEDYTIMFESQTPLDELPTLGQWRVPFDFFNKNDDKYTEEVSVELSMVYMKTTQIPHSGFPNKYFTELHIEISAS